MTGSLLVRLLGAGLLAALPATAMAAPPQRHFTGGLATPEQLKAESVVRRLVADPRVRALRRELRRIVAEVPAASSPTGAQQIDHSIDQWIMGLAMREVCADMARPVICWRTENSPHSWFGYTFPGMGVAGDDPDRIYRGSYLDGASTYEIRGRFPARRSAQFSLEATRGTPGGVVQTSQSARTPDMGNQIAFLEDVNMATAPDGSFVVTIGPEPAGTTRNHLTVTPGPINLIVRDTLSDWTEQPTQVTIRRIAGPAAGPPPTERQLLDQLVADLPEYVRFWANFNTRWLGGTPENALVGPAPRDGGWGYLAGGRFKLSRREAVVITTTDKGVRATGFQITNPLMIMPGDARTATVSLNRSQVARNPDGSVTYVLAGADPGVANWIDTGGLAEGMFVLRWEGVTKEVDPKLLIRSVRKVDLADLAAALPEGVPRVTRARRAAQIARRAKDYDVRLGRQTR